MLHSPFLRFVLLEHLIVEKGAGACKSPLSILVKGDFVRYRPVYGGKQYAEKKGGLW